MINYNILKMLTNSSLLFGLNSAQRLINRAAMSKSSIHPSKGNFQFKCSETIWATKSHKAWRIDYPISFLPLTFILDRRPSSQLWHHAGIQRAQEQEADEQLLGERSPHVLGYQLAPIQLRRPSRRQDQG